MTGKHAIVRSTRRLSLTLTALLALCVLHCTPAVSTPSGTFLVENASVEREIRNGETHVYLVAVPPNRYLIGEIDQHGADVLVQVINPSGVKTRLIDSLGSTGPEQWSLDGHQPGTWRLEVSLWTDAPPGRYIARIAENISIEEFAQRQALLHYESPRLFELWKEHRRDGPAAISRFVDEIKGHAPLIEPIANHPDGDMLLTFVRQAEPETRHVELDIPWPLSAKVEKTLTRFENTDLMYLTLHVPKDLRLTYEFRVGDPPIAGASAQERDARNLISEPDLWNPLRFHERSLVELPAAPVQAYIRPMPGVPVGRMVSKMLRSSSLGEDRPLGIYLPATFDSTVGSYPYLIVFDGDIYGHSPHPRVPTPTILDNLIASGKIPPTIAVFVPNLADTRMRDLAMSAKFCEFLALELAPWMQREFRVSPDPQKVTLVGASLGGLCAAYCGLHHSATFGNVLSQSGSFWYSPGVFAVQSPFHLEAGALIREFVESPTKPLRMWMEVGRLEEGSRLVGAGQVAQNRHMRDVLRAKGYFVTYHEYSGGHDHACWAGSLADGLVELVGAVNRMPHSPQPR